MLPTMAGCSTAASTPVSISSTTAIEAAVLHTATGILTQHAPVLYQDTATGRQTVAGRYVLRGGNQIGFQADAHDPTTPLVIDPVLSYSTYLGGSSDDDARSLVVDGSGNAYVTGITSSTDFPTTTGAYQTSAPGGGDGFVAKFDAAGQLSYSTYLGGVKSDNSLGIAVDSSGNAYVTGSTGSSSFPTTSGAYQTTLGASAVNAFVTKLNAAGSALSYSTLLGNDDATVGNSIVVNSSGQAVVTGSTTDNGGGTPFPTTSGAYQTTRAGTSDAFVTQFNASGTGLVTSTFLGGDAADIGQAVAVNSSGAIFVAGKT